MGVSVNKKQACPHLPPLYQTETAVRPMARPVPTRENTTVDLRRCVATAAGCCERIPLERASTHLPSQGPKQSARTRVPTREFCLRWDPAPCWIAHARGIPPRLRVGGGQTPRTGLSPPSGISRCRYIFYVLPHNHLL